MDAKLCPRDDLAELLEGSKAARHCHECIRELRHRRLTLVHRVHDSEIGQGAMRELARDQRVRDDANRMTAGIEHGIRDYTHQANAASAKDETDSAPHHLTAKLHCGLSVLRIVSGAGSAEHADAAKLHRWRGIVRGRQTPSLLLRFEGGFQEGLKHLLATIK